MNRGTLLIFILLLAFIINATSNRSKTSSADIPFINSADEIYQQLKLQELSFDAFKIALSGFSRLQAEELLNNDSLLTIIDYSLPSTQERFFVIDIKNLKVLKESLVAHGKSTGDIFPESFSNRAQSHKSSLGFYITENTYEGKHGYSLRINGVEENINDNAKDRAIVIHAANYVSRSYIQKYGRIGRSFGCPALPVDQNKQIIDLIKNNSCLFIYFPTSDYLKKSKLVIPKYYSQIIAE